MHSRLIEQFHLLFLNSTHHTEAKPKSEIDNLLKLLAMKANVEKLEEKIKFRPEILMEKGTYHSPYADCPENVTLLQCTYFYKYDHMYSIFKKYLSPDQIKTQLNELDNLLENYRKPRFAK